MQDYLLKALSFDNSVRIYAVDCTNALNVLAANWEYYPSALAAVGRTMAVSLMMGAMLKREETITVRVEGDGPIGIIMVDVDAHGHVRAYASNPYCHFEYTDTHKLNVAQTVGTTGFINVIKDLRLKEPFIGSTPIISGELGEDFAYYFSVSEQVPSVVSLGVLVGEDNRAIHAGGFIIQLLPNAPEEVIQAIEQKIADLPSMTSLLSKHLSLNEIITILGDQSTTFLEKVNVEYRCKCSRDRFERGLLSLGYTELREMDKDGQGAHIMCDFCKKEYTFKSDDITKLVKQSLQRTRNKYKNQN